jgi:hypothetical protein
MTRPIAVPEPRTGARSEGIEQARSRIAIARSLAWVIAAVVGKSHGSAATVSASAANPTRDRHSLCSTTDRVQLLHA